MTTAAPTATSQSEWVTTKYIAVGDLVGSGNRKNPGVFREIKSKTVRPGSMVDFEFVDGMRFSCGAASKHHRMAAPTALEAATDLVAAVEEVVEVLAEVEGNETIDRLKTLMASDRLKGHDEVRKAAEVEAAAVKAAKMAGQPEPATPVLSWMGSMDYKNRRDSAQQAAKGTGFTTTKARLTDPKARQDMVKEAVDAGCRTAGAVRKHINAKGLACSTDWIAPMLLGMIGDAPKATTLKAAPIKAAPIKATTSKAPVNRKTVTPITKASQTRNAGKSRSSVAKAS